MLFGWVPWLTGNPPRGCMDTKKRFPESMLASEAVPQARVEHMGETRPGGARSAMVQHKTNGVLSKDYDGETCGTFSEATSFSRFAQNRLSGWGSGLGRFSEGWTHCAGLRFRHLHLASFPRFSARDKFPAPPRGCAILVHNSLLTQRGWTPRPPCKPTPSGADALPGDFGGHWCPQAFG